jgi:hypothetical protein
MRILRQKAKDRSYNKSLVIIKSKSYKLTNFILICFINYTLINICIYIFDINPIDSLNFVMINTACFSCTMGIISLSIRNKFNNSDIFTIKNLSELFLIILSSLILRYTLHYILTECNLSTLTQYLKEIIYIYTIITISLSSTADNLGGTTGNNIQETSTQSPSTEGISTTNTNTEVMYEHPYIKDSDKTPVPAGRHNSDRIKLLTKEIVPFMSDNDHNGTINHLMSKIQSTRTDLSVIHAELNSVEHAMLKYLLKQSPNTHGFLTASGSINYKNVKCDIMVLQLADAFKK